MSFHSRGGSERIRQSISAPAVATAARVARRHCVAAAYYGKAGILFGLAVALSGQTGSHSARNTPIVCTDTGARIAALEKRVKELEDRAAALKPSDAPPQTGHDTSLPMEFPRIVYRLVQRESEKPMGYREGMPYFRYWIEFEAAIERSQPEPVCADRSATSPALASCLQTEVRRLP